MSLAEDRPARGRRYEIGDRVALIRTIRGPLRTLRRARVSRGTIGIVVSVAPAGDLIEVRFDPDNTELLTSDQLNRA